MNWGVKKEPAEVADTTKDVADAGDEITPGQASPLASEEPSSGFLKGGWSEVGGCWGLERLGQSGGEGGMG